jgi:coatomer subunit epsilon
MKDDRRLKNKSRKRRTMSEPDDLYTLRAQYWLGHYGLAVTEGKNLQRRPGLSAALKAEREEFVARAHLALQEYGKLSASSDSSSSSK